MEKNKPFDEEKVKEATKMLLEGLGEDINRPGLIDTPKRGRTKITKNANPKIIGV